MLKIHDLIQLRQSKAGTDSLYQTQLLISLDFATLQKDFKKDYLFNFNFVFVKPCPDTRENKKSAHFDLNLILGGMLTLFVSLIS